MTRRRFRRLVAAGAAGTTLGVCGVSSAMHAPCPPSTAFPPYTIGVGAMRITAIRTGNVAVKRAHREYSGPPALRLPAIALDPRWTPWLPITCWLVEHPEGPVVVDTGETARTAEPGYFGCDPGTQFVYERLLRFDVGPIAEVGPQLRRLGVDPESVRTVALTHLHSDHAGGLSHFPNATFYTSQAEAERPPHGALPCRWPPFFQPSPVVYGDGPFGAFGSSHAITTDGAVRLVPTPGHTGGHQSVLVEHEGRFVLLAGDASFSLDQVRRRAVAGVCADVGAARRTLAIVAEHLEQFPTAYLASHDPFHFGDA